MITFNVGPSKVYPEVSTYLQDAFNNNILSISHRSKTFDEISKNALSLLHAKLNIPTDYTIMYTGSATESWEVIAQDIVQTKATHFYNGEFGRKWFEYSKFINPLTQGFDFSEQDEIEIKAFNIDSDTELFGFTLNETSTGTQVRESVIRSSKEKFPNALIAIDTTSCLAGVTIDFHLYDIIFASVQKCFGLPSGLGLLICSPKTMKKASQKGVTGRYNSLLNMADKIKAFQTTYTPNVLNIYLLSRTLESIKTISETDAIVKKRASDWYHFISVLKNLSLHISNPKVQSDTVITVSGAENTIKKVMQEASADQIELGSGYGPLKATTFRIANFPAITDQEISILKSFMTNFCNGLG